MKIHFDNVNFNSRSGPNSFGFRLATQFSENGHQILLGDGREADVSLVFIEPSGNHLAKKIVQRLDGIWFSPKEFLAKNAKIKSLYEHADFVVWQSNFDKEMITRWWGAPKDGSVIRNGTKKHYKFDVNVQSQLDLLRKKYEKIFVCSANWHPQKRLKNNLEAFDRIKKFYNSACLIVLGSNPSIRNIPDVFIAGNQTHDACMQIFSSCDWMLHLAWLDHCPNTVVEAISQEVPVICSSSGGTKELVKNYGIIVEENEEYKYELTNYDNPPDIDVSKIISLPDRKSLGMRPDVSIETSFSKYLEIFENLLK